MFCLNFLSRKKHRPELDDYMNLKHSYEKLSKCHEDLLNGFVRVADERDVLKEQIGKLRSINAKRKDENDNLKEKNNKLKDTVKMHEGFRHALKIALPTVNFNGYSPVLCNEKCSDCIFDDHDCKKYTNLSICMMPNEITRSCKE